MNNFVCENEGNINKACAHAHAFCTKIRSADKVWNFSPTIDILRFHYFAKYRKLP